MGLSYNPSIVVDGLQYALDVANPKCYSGSGNTTFDLTGRVAPGSLVNGPTYNINLNGFFTFDGTNDYIDCGNFLDNLSNFTVAAWVKTTSAVMQMVVAKLVNYSSGAGWALFLHPTLGVSLLLQTNGSVWIVYSSNKSINDNSWHYISAVINNKIVTAFYVDGISYPVTSQGQGTVTNYSNGINVRIARNEANEYIFQGDISQAHLYSKSLSAAEILQNYNANRGRYLYNADIATNGLVNSYDIGSFLTYPGSGSRIYNNYSGTAGTADLRNGSTVSGSGMTSYVDFSGSSANVVAFSSTSFRSISFVAYISSSQYYSYYLLDGRNDIANSYYYINGPGVWTNLYVNGNKKTAANLSDTTIFPRNTWLHIYMELPSLSTGVLYFGNRYSFNEPLTGRLAAIQFYNRTLTQSEIIQNYDAFRGRF